MPFRIKEFVNLYLESYKEIFLKGAGIRNIGAAALEICYVACGRLDAFWELGLSPWDMAAGALIVSEAGGIVSDFWGKQNWLETGCIIASNKKLYEPLLSIISKHFEKI
jgi:myo-inositol-1(or 4)-monophosphatase